MRPTNPIRPLSGSRRRERGAARAKTTSRAEQSAGAVLGPTHPLTRATEAVEGVARQWHSCAAVLAGAIIAELQGHPWAPALAVSAGIVLVALTTLVAALKQRVRDRATALIAEGRETLPIAIVQRQRQRLLARRTRMTLAHTLHAMVRDATSPPRIETIGARRLFDAVVIAAVANDLRAVVSLLQNQHARARGVALTERLITDGGSALYSDNEIRLREELNRVRGVLEERLAPGLKPGESSADAGRVQGST